MKPGTVYLVVSREKFKFSNRLVGVVESSPCTNIWPLQNYIHACFESGFIDPGYEGHVTMQVYSNIGPVDATKPLTIMTVYPVKGKVKRPYNHKTLGSSHQGNLK